MGVHVPPAHSRFNNKMYEKFIDVDVMKSMTELTSKPKHRVSTLRFGMLRVLLFPLYRCFWCSAIGLPFLTWLGISLLYICQLAACVLHYSYLSDASPHITASEVYFPPLLLLFSGFCFGRIPTAGADKIKELHSSPFAKSHPHSAATHKDRLPALVVTPRNVPRLPGSRGFHPPPRIDVSVPEASRRAGQGGGSNGASEPQKLAPYSPQDRLRPCSSSNSNSSGEASASAVRTNTKLRRGRKGTGGGVRAALASAASDASGATGGGGGGGASKQKGQQKTPAASPSATTSAAAAAGGASSSSSSSHPSTPPAGDYLDGAVLVSTPMAAMVSSFRSGASSVLDTQASAAAAAAAAVCGGGGEEALCASRTASSREMRQEQYTVQNEAEEQITESDEDSDDSATEEVSAGAASGVDAAGRGLLPPTLEGSVEGAREALLVEDEPLSKIDDISVLLWVDEALLNAAPSEGIYSRKAEMMRAPHATSAHPAAAAAGRKKRSRKRPPPHRGDCGGSGGGDADSRTSESPLSSPKNVLYSRGEHQRHSSAASSAGGSQATSPSGRSAAAAAAAAVAQTQRVPVKSGMTVIEIRRCILACVDRACATEASELDKPQASAKFASLIFALFPSLYRVLFSLADRGARSLRALAAALLLLYGDDAPLCRGGTGNPAEAPHASALFAYLCPRGGGRVEGTSDGNYTEAGWNLHAADAAEAAEAVLNDAVWVVLGQRSGDAADSPVPGSPGAGAALSLFVVVSTGLCVYFMVGKLATYLSVAERTYRKRYLYAKYFSAITSLRRSQRYGLPHFRLKNVQNVMAWLSLRGSRAWLRHESQEVAADTIVSITFQLFLFVLALVGMMVIQESGGKRTQASSLGMENFSEVFHGQIFLLTVVISYYLLHFMMTGTSINHKYGNASLLLTEQLNIHLRIVAVSDRTAECTESVELGRLKLKKEKLQLTSKVLELAAKLLKELEGPNKISGFSMNPFLYNITRVMVLSCLSAAISHVLGFSPKLWKI